MSDETEIEKTLRLIFDNMPAQVEAREFLRDLHAAGYEIEPKWSDDLDSAPRDGTEVDLWCLAPRGAFVAKRSARIPNCWWFNGKWWRYDEAHGDGECKSEVANVTHWRPRPTPPKESGE